MTDDPCKLLVTFNDDGEATAELVPLDADELAQRMADEAIAQEQPASERADAIDTAGIGKRLAAGVATDADIQTALATLLGALSPVTPTE